MVNSATCLSVKTVQQSQSLPQDSGSIVDLLATRAQHYGQRPLYSFLSFDDSQANPEAGLFSTSTVYTYAELHARSCAIGGWLQRCQLAEKRSILGQRILLVFPSGLDYLAAYFGCLYAGAIAVPAYPPRRNRRADRLRAIVRDAGLTMVLAPQALIDSLKETIEADDVLCSLHWQAIESIPNTFASAWCDPQVNQDSIAFLQYTSGSTGDPKGVVVKHGNLLHNQSLIRTHFATQRSSGSHAPRQLRWDQSIEESETLVGWVPLHHDMGLIGNVLHPLYAGGQLVFMAPIDFLQKPIRWLQAISQFRATISGGPNFAYRICSDEIDLKKCEGIDLSSWQVAFNGAEPIDADVLHRFAEKFNSLGFSTSQFCPCYGMAETTLLITSSTCGDALVLDRQPGEQQRSSLVGCGEIVASEMDIRIVDPETSQEKAAGDEGEIWAAGGSVAAGYWNRPEQTEQTFAARLNGCDTLRFLRTGDIGYSRDGQLYVTGRLKDLIIIRGVNHYPQDIERTVEQAHPALQIGGGAAFSIQVDGEERLAVIQEVRRTELRGLDVNQVCDAIHAAVIESHDLRVAGIRLIRPGGVPKTTSGKVQRGQARRQYLANQFHCVGQWDELAAAPPIATSPTPESVPSSNRFAVNEFLNQSNDDSKELRQWLLSKIALRLKLAPAQVDVHQPLSNYGLDSLAAVRLAGEASEHLGRAIPPTLAYEYPTIALIADYLTGRAENIASESASGKAEQVGPVNEPLAIVGIGCRFPGASSAEQFWQLLSAGGDAIGERLDLGDGREFAAATENRVNGGVPTKAGYIEQVDRFDAAFFGIHPREADAMDPQQRLMLETTWQAFEDAGIPINNSCGKSVGVFVGAGNNDYSRLRANVGNAYGATGNSLAMTANRLSYTFDFRGPSLTIDTACSSSLVATHQAIGSLRRGECSLAVVGGVNLILSDETTTTLSQAGMLSPSGTCRAMSAGADGFVRGEGCGVVLIKPLSQALADGNRVYAVVRGSAVNQDGRTNGLTAPSRIAQQQLIEAALRDAHARPEEIDYVEAHGTGTELGDPIEMRAIRAALIDAAVPQPAVPQPTFPQPTFLEPAAPRPADLRPQELIVGAVKTNIGHLEAAAGIAGLIKVCLSLSHSQIPATLNFQEPNPHINFNGVVVPQEKIAWPSDVVRTRIAGISSFGFGGANAHVIVQQAPPQPTTADATNSGADSTTPQLCFFSARTEDSLDKVIANASAIDAELPLSDVAHTLASGRTHHRLRAAVICDSPNDLREHGPDYGHRLIRGQAASEKTTTWLFSGQGGVFVGAGRQLHATHSTFRRCFDEARAACLRIAGIDLQSVLWDDESKWKDIQIQPALYCLQWALARTYADMGLTPDVVLGHSLGEYAAACVAGVFNFEDGLRIVSKRAELTGKLSERGGMLAVFADEQTVANFLAEQVLPCDIAAINGPRQTVVAGLKSNLEQLAMRLAQVDVTTRMMQTTHGFHSRLIEPVLDDFEQFVKSIQLSKPACGFVSSQTGKWLTGDEAEQVATPTYWRNNLRCAVRFFDALQALDAGLQAFTGDEPSDNHAALMIEIGAGSTLSSIVRSAKLGRPAGSDPQATVPQRVLPGLISGEQERGKFLENIARLYVNGYDLNWQSAFGYQAEIVTLPTYPFARERFWYGQHTQQPRRPQLGNDPLSTCTDHSLLGHSLLGQHLDLATESIVYQNQLWGTSFWVDHKVGSTIIFPAAGVLEWAQASGRQINATGYRLAVTGLQITKPLVLDTTDYRLCQVVLTEIENGWRGQLLCRTTQAWEQHAMWTYGVARNWETDWVGPLSSDQFVSVDVQRHYVRCSEAGLQYGPAFRGIESLERLGKQARSICSLPAEATLTVDGNRFSFHPALLDACLQTIAVTEGNWGKRSWLPVGCEQYVLHQNVLQGEKLHVVVRVREAKTEIDTRHPDIRFADLQISSSHGHVVAEIHGLQLHATAPLCVDELVYEQSWLPQIREREPNWTRPVSDAGLRLSKTNKLAQNYADTDGQHIANLLDVLESISGKCAVEVLRRLGLEFQIGTKFTRNEVTRQLKILPQHHRLLHRLLSIGTESGFLQSHEDGWDVVAAPASLDIASLFDQAMADYPKGKNEFTLLHRCVSNAAECLTSGKDPLPLLFPSDGQVSVGEVYRDSAGGRLMNQLVASAVGEIADELPAGRGLRVLEIGAGTGATTDSVLPMLPNGRAQYRFTDIANSFLSAARQRFANLDFIDYQILDIEREPDQSLVGQFDLIIAANVLHATSDLVATISHSKKLLSSSGQMLVIEGTRPVRWMDLTFGLTSGWWRFTDTDLRPDYPLLSPQGWRDLLDQQGFTGTQIISPQLKPETNRHAENSLIVTSKVVSDLESSSGTCSDRRILLVTPQDSAIQHSLRSSLHDHCRSLDSFAWDQQLDSTQSGDSLISVVQNSQLTDLVILLDEDTYTEDVDVVTRAYHQTEHFLTLLQRLIAYAADTSRQVDKMPRLWLVTTGSQSISAGDKVDLTHAALIGMWRTLVLEQPTWNCSSIDLELGQSAQLRGAVVADEILAAGSEQEPEVAFRSGQRLVRRLQRTPANRLTGANSSRVLEIAERGSLDGLRLAQRPRRSPARGEVEIAVRAAGLNFRDVLNTLDLYPSQPPLGAECTGVVCRLGEGVLEFEVGQRVAVLAAETLADFVTAPIESVVILPESIDFEQAATIPVAYLTAAVSLLDLGQLLPGDHVLIHSAAGGVGMAAIAIAKHIGATIYATAGTTKHSLLRSLGVDHVYDSRTDGFAEAILTATAGRGVDLVLNSLDAARIPENHQAMTRGGRYVDITVPR